MHKIKISLVDRLMMINRRNATTRHKPGHKHTETHAKIRRVVLHRHHLRHSSNSILPVSHPLLMQGPACTPARRPRPDLGSRIRRFVPYMHLYVYIPKLYT